MIPTLFTGSVLIAPGAALISSGYVAGNTLAAQNLNWYLYHLTKELNNLLMAGGITQNTADDTQVTQAVRKAANQSAVSLAASYTPTAGDVVEINEAGLLRKAVRGVRTVLASGSVVAGCGIAALDDTHLIALYVVGLALNAVIVTIDPNTLVATYGTPLSVFTFTTSAPQFAIVKSGPTQALIAYTVGPANAFNQLKVQTLTANIGAGTITANAAVNGAASVEGVALYPIPGSANYFLAYSASVITNISGAVVSISGTVPTINAAASITATANQIAGGPLVVNSDGNLAVVAWYNGTATQLSTFTISGTTATAGSTTSTGLASSSSTVSGMEEIQRGHMILTAGATATGMGNAKGFYGFELNTGGPTIIATQFSPFLPLNEVFNGSESMIVRAVDKTEGVFVCWISAPFNQDGHFVTYQFFAKVAGGRNSIITQAQIGDVFSYDPGGLTNFQGGIDITTSGIAVSAGGVGTISLGSIIATRRRNRVVGVAVDALGTIQTAGIFTTTGLTAGAIYYADDVGNLTTTPSEVAIGKALSTTQLLISVRTGV